MRQFRKYAAITCIILILSAVTAKAQQTDFLNLVGSDFETYNFEFTGSGSRALGMGNAYIGVSDDAYAIGWNPAGLYRMESPVIGFNYTSLNPKGSFDSERLDISRANFTGERFTFDQSGSINNLTAASFLAPIRIKGHPFVGSIAYTRNSDEYQKQGYVMDVIEQFPVFNEAGAFLYIDSVFTNINIESELRGGIDAVNVGFGTRLFKNVAFGTTLNIYAGSVQRVTDIYVTGDGVPVNNFQQGDATVFGKEIDSNKFSGFNVTVGFKMDGEQLDAGLVVRTPFALNQKGEQFSSEIVNINGIPIETDTTFEIDKLTKYDIPLMVGFGLGYKVNESWLLAADVEYRHFSSSKIKVRENLILVPGANNIEEFLVLSDEQWQWSNVLALRLGTEYLNETSIGTIPLRAGLGYAPVPTPNTDAMGNRSTANSFSFSLGSGLHWDQIKLDLGYMYRTHDIEVGGFLSEEKSQNHFLEFSFTGYF